METRRRETGEEGERGRETGERGMEKGMVRRREEERGRGSGLNPGRLAPLLIVDAYPKTVPHLEHTAHKQAVRKHTVHISMDIIKYQPNLMCQRTEPNRTVIEYVCVVSHLCCVAV